MNGHTCLSCGANNYKLESPPHGDKRVKAKLKNSIGVPIETFPLIAHCQQCGSEQILIVVDMAAFTTT